MSKINMPFQFRFQTFVLVKEKKISSLAFWIILGISKVLNLHNMEGESGIENIKANYINQQNSFHVEQHHMVSLLFHFHQNNLGSQIKKRTKINFCTKWVTTAPCEVFQSFIH